MTDIVKLTNLQNFHAQNPDAKCRYESRMRDALKRYAEFYCNVVVVSGLWIPTAENFRKFGEAMTEIEAELPGHKFTRDFYEQMKDVLIDSRGQTIPFERIEYSLRWFKSNPEPITTVTQALQMNKGYREVAGELDFRLENQTQRGHVVGAADELKELYKLLDESSWQDAWEAFKKNPNYFNPETGKVIEHQRGLVKERAQVLFRVVEEMKLAVE